MQLWSMEVHSQLVLRRQLWIEKRLWKDLMAKDDVTHHTKTDPNAKLNINANSRLQCRA